MEWSVDYAVLGVKSHRSGHVKEVRCWWSNLQNHCLTLTKVFVKCISASPHVDSPFARSPSLSIIVYVLRRQVFIPRCKQAWVCLHSITCNTGLLCTRRVTIRCWRRRRRWTQLVVGVWPCRPSDRTSPETAAPRQWPSRTQADGSPSAANCPGKLVENCTRARDEIRSLGQSVIKDIQMKR